MSVPATVFDYPTLQSDLQDWLWRADAKIQGQIRTLIKLAHDRINRNLRITAMMTRATIPGNGTRFYPLPGDSPNEEPYLDMRSLRIKGTSEAYNDQLIQVSPEGLRIDPSNIQPSRYCIHREIELNSALSSAYTMEMTYYTPFPELTDQDPINWITTYSYDLYLYGALTEAEPFLRNDERLPVWAERFKNAIDEWNFNDARSRRNQSELRQMQPPQEWAP